MKLFRRSVSNTPRKRSLLLIVIIAAIASGLIILLGRDKPGANPVQIDAKYVSLDGGYLFSIPAKYTSTGAALPGVTLTYPETLGSLNGKSLEELYKVGVVAAQPITALKDNNVKAFKDYVSDTFANDLRESVHSTVDVRYAKQGGIDALKVFALAADGKRLRVVYAINFTQPVMVVASEESDALKVVGGTIEDLEKTKYKFDIDQVVESAKSIAEMLQKQDASGLRRKATGEFNKSVSSDKLKDELKFSTSYLDRSIIVTGGSYNGKLFIAELIFEPKNKDQTPAGGVISLKKESKTWKLDALQLPK